MGALVTVSSWSSIASADLPWILTVGPLSDEDEWEPVVCGPYERAHALALGEAVARDDDVMAVVEPVRPYPSLDQIRMDVVAARAATAAGPPQEPSDRDMTEVEWDLAERASTGSLAEPDEAQIRSGFERIALFLRSV